MERQWKTYEKESVLVNNEKDFLKQTGRANHITHKIFGKNYATIHEIKPVLTPNQPIYVGFTVLELSKWLITALLKSTKKHLRNKIRRCL